MRKIIPIIVVLTVIIWLWLGCLKAKPEQKAEEVLGKVNLEFIFSRDHFSEGEAVCLRIVLRNESRDTISLVDFPMKNLQLFDSEGQPVLKAQRARFPKPPKMWIAPGDSSYDEVNLTGFFENSGPGMLAPGRYKLKTSIHYFAGKQIRLRISGYALNDSTFFEVVPPTGKDKDAMEAYRRIMTAAGELQEMVGNTQLTLTEDTQKKLDSLAEEYPHTAIGERILINDLSIWYRAVPLERYAKFMEEVPAECPCCLHSWLIDRLIKRYVIEEERETILDIADEGLKKYPEDTPVGDYLRKAFGFRIKDGVLER